MSKLASDKRCWGHKRCARLAFPSSRWDGGGVGLMSSADIRGAAYIGRHAQQFWAEWWKHLPERIRPHVLILRRLPGRTDR